MNALRHKLLYEAHSWAGLVLGFLLFLVCFSGAVCLFAEELRPWTLAALDAEQSVPRAGIGRAYAQARARGLVAAGDVMVHWPTPQRPSFGFRAQGADGKDVHLPAAGGPAFADPGADLAEFIGELHRNLLIEGDLGRYLLGFVGLAMLFSVLSGVLVHPKILRELFSLRLARSTRLALTDAHKLFGVWGLPFHLMISATGALLGLANLLLLLGVLAAYRGDAGTALADLDGPPAAVSGQAAPLPDLDALVGQALSLCGEAEILYLDLHAPGDATARYDVALKPRTVLSSAETFQFDAQGRLLRRVSYTARGAWLRVYGAISPLHYGTYGGLGLRLIYAFLGLACAGLVASGLLVWLERRLVQRQSRAAGHRLAARLALGLCGGLPLAYAAVFAGALVLPAQPDGRYTALIACFFAAWALAVCAALRASRPWPVLRALLGLAGLVLGGCALGHALCAYGPLSRGVDAGLAVCAIALLALARVVPAEQAAPARAGLVVCADNSVT